MSNPFFRFKQFTIRQDHAAMKVTTDSCLFGAWIANYLAGKSQIQTVLDIGTGTGLLSLMIAQQSAAKIEAVEIDSNATIDAEKNIAESKWNDRIHVVQSDIRDVELSTFDVIVSNPPFYERSLHGPDKAKNLAHHSSALLLDELLHIISRHLSTAGCFFLLLPSARLDEVIQKLFQYNIFLHELVLVKQTEKHSPFRLMVRGTNSRATITEKEIIIKQEGNYSRAFTDLLSPYYLAL